MLKVDQLRNGGFERLLTQVPRGAPGKLPVREVGQLGHLLQAEVAGLGKDRRVQMRDQVLGAWLGAARVLESASEADPAINLNQEFG